MNSLLSLENSQNLLLLGDFNINLLSDSDIIDSYTTILANHGLYSFINESTRPATGTCLDHLLGRFKELQNVYVCYNFHLSVSDHCLTGISLNTSSVAKKSTPPKTFLRLDYGKLNSYLLHETWNEVYNETDVSLANSLFLKKFKFYINSSTESKVLRQKHDQKLQPWVTDNLLKKIQLKNKLGAKSLKHPDNLSLKKRFKKLAKEIKKEVPKARNNFFQSKFVSCRGNIKKEWRLVNDITNRSPKSKNTINLKINDSISNDERTVANEFNDYFASVGTSLIPLSSDNSNIEIVNDQASLNSFVFENISANEIIKIINALDNSNSCGCDQISNKTLKKCVYNISDILAYLFNMSVNTGIFPTELKLAVVIPLFKKGDRSNKQNYRPISLLSSISKVFEKCIKKRMLEFLLKNSFFSSKQFGFREGISTEDALLDFYTFIHKGLDDKLYCASFFVDITKAFDMVNHEILLYKLYRIGFRGNMYKWLKTYLYNRTQRVKVGSTLSNSVNMKLGVPQGSVLGPILFLIYINSIFQQDFRGKVTAFADDLALAYKSSTTFDLVCDINNDSAVLRNWFYKHKLLISDKSKIMFFNFPSNTPPNVELVFHDSCCPKFNFHSSGKTYNAELSCSPKCFVIENVNEFKYLGIWFDSKLSWNKHTTELKLYFRSVVRKFYHLSQICTPHVLKMFYFGLFHSKLSYGITCWGGAYLNKIKPLLTLQKCMIRNIHNASTRSPSFNLFKSSNILPVRHLFYFQAIKKFISNNSHVNNRIPGVYNLRRADSIYVPPFRTTSYMNSYSIASCRLFNKIPGNIKVIHRKNSFLRRLKDWLLTYNFALIETLLQVAH